MMSIYYASSTNGFYDDRIHGKFGSMDGHIPADAKLLTDDQFSALILAQQSGKTINPDSNGFPVATNLSAS